jgi:hypothetical protein
MNSIWSCLRDWLVEAFGFVTKEDYDFVQDVRWRTENEVRRLIQERYDLMDSIYDRKFKPLEEVADAPLETIQMNTADFRGKRFTWSVIIPDRRFVMTFDLEQEMYVMKKHVLEKLTAAFHKHIGDQMFKQPL